MDIIRLFSNELIVKHERMLQGFPTEMTEESKNNNGQNFRHREKYNQLNIWEVWNFVFISSGPSPHHQTVLLRVECWKNKRGKIFIQKMIFKKENFCITSSTAYVDQQQQQQQQHASSGIPKVDSLLMAIWNSFHMSRLAGIKSKIQKDKGNYHNNNNIIAAAQIIKFNCSILVP